MKKLSLLFCLCVMATVTFAQLPDGSSAPAFTGYEINKTTGTIITSDPIVLFDYTDAGYTVYMDVFATWCGPCWSYHTGGYLENLYSQYGPEGTNEVRVLAIEGSNGNYASLSGTGPDAGGSATQGNWLNGVEYPVIPLRMSPNTMAFDNDYAIAYFPTLYMVCPNRLVYEVGQQNTAGLYAAKNTCPQFDNSLANNALLLSVNNVDPIYFCSCTTTPSVKLQNVGSAPLTAATLSIELDGQTSTFDWTGNLQQYASTTVTLPQIDVTAEGSHTYKVTVSTVNGVADTDLSWNMSSANFRVSVTPTSTTFSEDFSNGIPDEWANPESHLFVNSTSNTHGNAVCFKAYALSDGTIDNLYLPFENLSNLTNPTLSFDVAHKRYSTSYTERLRVMYSTNCGLTWSNLYSKSGSSLATASGTVSSNFVPSDDQWRNETISLSNITDPDEVIIKFEFKSGYGNNIWIDNVAVSGETGIPQNDEFGINIYPNPASDAVRINTSDNVQRVEIFNMQGQLVKVETGEVSSISVKDLANGMYTLKLTTDNGVSMHKFVKQ